MIDGVTLHEAGMCLTMSLACWMLDTKRCLNGAGVEGRGWRRMESLTWQGLRLAKHLQSCMEVWGLHGSFCSLVLLYVSF